MQTIIRDERTGQIKGTRSDTKEVAKDANRTRAEVKAARGQRIPADDPIWGDAAVGAATVAKYLGMSYARTLDAAERGDIPGRKIGGRWKFSPHAIRALLGEN